MLDLDPETPHSRSSEVSFRLTEAQAEYAKLRDAVAALGSHLAALQSTGTAQLSHPSLDTSTDYLAAILRPEPPLQTEALPVRVNLLGPFALQLGGRNLGPGVPGQVRTVLEFLVSQGRRPTPRDALLDLLWPDADPDVACSRLRVVMHTLRKTLPSAGLGFHDLVVMSGNNFMLNPEAQLWVDVEEFEHHWLAGWRLAKSGRAIEALSEYEQAEALYRGDYLEDEPYADWTLLRREALRDAYANILLMLATMSLEGRDYIGCIIWSQKLLAQDNCREDAYRMLMVSHRQLGQSSRAAYWYSLCGWALQRELGIEPSAETRALFNSL